MKSFIYLIGSNSAQDKTLLQSAPSIDERISAMIVPTNQPR